MPVEFSVAAYRIGHSLVRFNYSLNHLSDPPTSFLSSTSTRAMTCGGGKPFKPEHRVSWFRFFHFPEITDPKLRDKLQPGRAIDTQLVFGLGGLPPSVGAAPTGPQNLAERNLKRGKALGLPTGQAVAHAMGIPTDKIISSNNQKFPFSIGTGYPNDENVPNIAKDVKARLTTTFADNTPLWYYILKEAELIQKGQMLVPVGGRIVAEVFIGLLLSDPQSYLVAQPNFQPKAGKFRAPQDGQFGIADLIRQAVKDPLAND